MSFLQHRSAQVDKLNGDRVLPLRLLDSNEAFTRLAVDFTLRFDDVLDPEKLHNSIKRLVQLGTWNQLGVRYKKNVSTRSLLLLNLWSQPGVTDYARTDVACSRKES